MRRFYLVAILLASVGCERIEPDQTQSPLRPSEETPALMKVHARVDETRTSLGGPRGTEVRWSAGDAIALWGEDSPVCRRYAIDDRFAGGTSADFTGEAFESAVYYACYPYCPDAVGIEYFFISSFANTLEPSICAAAAVGPNEGIPASARASTAPSTSGSSGATTA